MKWIERPKRERKDLEKSHHAGKRRKLVEQEREDELDSTWSTKQGRIIKAKDIVNHWGKP